jgi:hypothetical protein
VLGARGEEILDPLPADVVDFFVAGGALLHVLGLTVFSIGTGGFAVGLQEGLRGGVG